MQKHLFLMKKYSTSAFELDWTDKFPGIEFGFNSLLMGSALPSKMFEIVRSASFVMALKFMNAKLQSTSIEYRRRRQRMTQWYRRT